MPSPRAAAPSFLHSSRRRGHPALLIAACLASAALAQAEPPAADPEVPRQPPADAYQQLPEVAKQMLESAAPKADAADPANADPAAAITPVARLESRGTGPTHIVLIPGIACDWTVWDAFMARNAQRYTMHAVTLPGFGASPPPPAPNADSASWSTDLWMLNARRAVSSAIAGLNLPSPPVVIGHSMGAQVALRLALEEPERVSAAVMVDGFAAWPLTPTPIPLEARRTMVDNQLAGFFDTQMAANDAAGIRQMYLSGVTDPARGQALAEMSKSTPTDVFKRYFLELVSSDHTAGLKSLTRPVLVLAAVAPPPAPAQPGQAEQPDTRDILKQVWRTQFDGIDRVKLEFVEDARHFIMDDAPDRFDALVASFTKELKPSTP